MVTFVGKVELLGGYSVRVLQETNGIYIDIRGYLLQGLPHLTVEAKKSHHLSCAN